jgi:hypothetical protein
MCAAFCFYPGAHAPSRAIVSLARNDGALAIANFVSLFAARRRKFKPDWR